MTHTLWRRKADAQTLGAIYALVFDRIPRDPLSPEFRQGNTLGKEHRHWFRAKFGGSRFRLFFRADSQAKVIVYAWVNDRDTLRKAGASIDRPRQQDEDGGGVGRWVWAGA